VSQKTPQSKLALALALSITGAVVLTFVALVIGGAAAPTQLLDAGPLVRFGLPIVKALFDLSLALTIGSLSLAAFSVAQPKPGEAPLNTSLGRLLNLAAVGSAAWVVTGFINLLFTYLSVAGTSFSLSNQFGAGFWLFASSIQLGQYLSMNLLAGLLVSILVLAVSRLTGTLLLAVLSLLSLVPLALTGHASGTANHSTAVNALGIHLVAVSIWVGGLMALFAVRKQLTHIELVSVTKRYSTLALFMFVLVAISGIDSAWVRVLTFANLATPYGWLILGKIAFLVILGVFGAIYRGRILRQFDSSKFFRLVAVELVMMGAAIGLASALARTAPPINELDLSNPTPAQILTGEKLPPELTPITLLTLWKPDLIWLLVVLVATSGYLLGVARLKKRGDSWPVSRTVSWVTGMLLLLYITSGPLNTYEQYLFSVHMISHMMLTMGVPLFLVPGAPITLLLRAVQKRDDESRGVREWVLWAVHTKYAQFISHPLVAAVMFASSLVVFYFTPLFSWATREHIGHEWMIVHFLITGYLFIQALVGIDPGPKRLSYPIRLMLLVGTLAFHAFFGLALMTGDGLLLADWFGAMGRTWGQDPIADQQTGGAIAWGIGELPTAALTLIVSVQWARSDNRESRRLDRASDRTGNQDIEQYNAMLAKLAERKEQRN
jgi:cytochrome c oxidase assembly factor CtaG/putative copper export protein